MRKRVKFSATWKTGWSNKHWEKHKYHKLSCSIMYPFEPFIKIFLVILTKYDNMTTNYNSKAKMFGTNRSHGLPLKRTNLKYIEIGNIVCHRPHDNTVLVVYQFPPIMYFTHRFKPGKIVVVNKFHFTDSVHVFKIWDNIKALQLFLRIANRK